MQTESPIVEMVTFRLKPAVTEADLLAAVDATQPIIARLPGFLDRELLRGEDGVWVDVVHWRSYAEALAAAEAFPTLPELAPFGALIDETQVVMQHLARARQFA